MSDPVWRLPKEAMGLAIKHLNCGAKDAGDWLVTAMHNELRLARAQLAKVHDSNPPRLIKGQTVPNGLWSTPRFSAWTSEFQPPVPFGWSFWNTGNREVIGAGGIKIDLIGVEIDVADMVGETTQPPAQLGGSPTSSGRDKSRPALLKYRDRMKAGLTLAEKAAEAREIHSALGSNAALAATIAESYLPRFHNLIQWSDDRTAMLNQREVLAALSGHLGGND